MGLLLSTRILLGAGNAFAKGGGLLHFIECALLMLSRILLWRAAGLEVKYGRDCLQRKGLDNRSKVLQVLRRWGLTRTR